MAEEDRRKKRRRGPIRNPVEDAPFVAQVSQVDRRRSRNQLPAVVPQQVDPLAPVAGRGRNGPVRRPPDRVDFSSLEERAPAAPRPLFGPAEPVVQQFDAPQLGNTQAVQRQAQDFIASAPQGSVGDISNSFGGGQQVSVRNQRTADGRNIPSFSDFGQDGQRKPRTAGSQGTGPRVSFQGGPLGGTYVAENGAQLSGPQQAENARQLLGISLEDAENDPLSRIKIQKAAQVQNVIQANNRNNLASIRETTQGNLTVQNAQNQAAVARQAAIQAAKPQRQESVGDFSKRFGGGAFTPQQGRFQIASNEVRNAGEVSPDTTQALQNAGDIAPALQSITENLNPALPTAIARLFGGTDTSKFDNLTAAATSSPQGFSNLAERANIRFNEETGGFTIGGEGSDFDAEDLDLEDAEPGVAQALQLLARINSAKKRQKQQR